MVKPVAAIAGAVASGLGIGLAYGGCGSVASRAINDDAGRPETAMFSDVPALVWSHEDGPARDWDVLPCGDSVCAAFRSIDGLVVRIHFGEVLVDGGLPRTPVWEHPSYTTHMHSARERRGNEFGLHVLLEGLNPQRYPYHFRSWTVDGGTSQLVSCEQGATGGLYVGAAANGHAWAAVPNVSGCDPLCPGLGAVMLMRFPPEEDGGDPLRCLFSEFSPTRSGATVLHPYRRVFARPMAAGVEFFEFDDDGGITRHSGLPDSQLRVQGLHYWPIEEVRVVSTEKTLSSCRRLFEVSWLSDGGVVEYESSLSPLFCDVRWLGEGRPGRIYAVGLPRGPDGGYLEPPTDAGSWHLLVARVDPSSGVLERQYVHGFPPTLSNLQVVEHGTVPLLFYDASWSDGGVLHHDIWVKRLELTGP